MKTCWGDKAVSAANNTKDLDGAHTILAKSRLKRDGSITSAFKHIGKEKVIYSHHQYTHRQGISFVLQYNMLNFAYQYRKAINKIIDIWDMKLCAYKIEVHEWKVVQQLHDLLKVSTLSISFQTHMAAHLT